MTLDAVSDDRQVLHAMTQDLAALDILYTRHRTLAFSIAQRITGDASLAEEVVQDAFVGVWRNADRYDPARSSVRTWLMAMVHHRAIDAVRRRRRRPTTELPDHESSDLQQDWAPDVWLEVSAHIDAADVRRAMNVLTEAQRRAIELAYFGGLTQQEIADLTSTPLGTVKSRIRSGLLAMRRVLAREADALAS